MSKLKYEEGVYLIKRVETLPKNGNANYLYTTDVGKINTLHRWSPRGEYETLIVGDGNTKVNAGNNVTITGDGTSTNAYTISSVLASLQAGTNVTITGTGTSSDPYVINSTGGGGGGTDPNAIHDNVAGEIAAITEKTTPVDNDIVLIEDSADSNNKKRVSVANLRTDVSGFVPYTGATSNVDLNARSLNNVRSFNGGVEMYKPAGGTQTIFLGFASSDLSTGDDGVLIGDTAGNRNSGNFVIAIGEKASEANNVNNIISLGQSAARFNKGQDTVAIGSSSSRFNKGTRITTIGNSTNIDLIRDTGNQQTFSFSNVSTGGVFTITGHSFGSVGEFVPLEYVEGTSPIYLITTPVNVPLLSGVYIFQVVDANTLQLKNSTNIDTNTSIAGPGSGTGHTLIPALAITNSTAIGYGAQFTKSNQVVLGDSNVTEIFSEAVFKSNVAVGGITDNKHLITLEYFNANSGGGTDPNAIHDNVAGEINAITEKVTPTGTDLILIEDSADSNNKKKIQVSNLPSDVSGTASENQIAIFNAVNKIIGSNFHTYNPSTKQYKLVIQEGTTDQYILEDNNGNKLIHISGLDLTSAAGSMKFGDIDDAAHTLIYDINFTEGIHDFIGDIRMDDAIADSIAAPRKTINQGGTTHTLVLINANNSLVFTNASAKTVTIPTNASVAFPIFTEITLINRSATDITVSPDGGVTLNSEGSITTIASYSKAMLKKLATDEWVLLDVTQIAGGEPSDGDKGDITVTGGVWTIDNGVVTYSKIQNAVANNVFLGNNNGAGSSFEELNATQARTILNVEDGADVTDEANVVAALSGSTLTDVGTPASDDKILLLDTSDSDNLKYADFSEFGGSTLIPSTLFVSTTGSDITGAPFDPNRPYRTLNTAITQFKAVAGVKRIHIMDSDSYTITQSILEETVGKDLLIFAPHYVSGQILIDFTGSIFNGTPSTLNYGLKIDARSMALSTASTGAMNCDKLAKFIEIDADSVVTNVNFAGWKTAKGYQISDTVTITSNALYDTMSDFTLTANTINFTGDNGRIADFGGSSITLDWGRILSNERFFLIGFLNPNVGNVIVKHGSIITSRTALNTYIRTYGDTWCIHYKEDIVLQQNNVIDNREATVTFMGTANYASNTYLLNNHNVSANPIILDNADITVAKLINANWNQNVISKNSTLSITDELGTVGTATNTALIIRNDTTINQTNPGSQLITGAANTINLESALFTNNTNRTNSTVVNVNEFINQGGQKTITAAYTLLPSDDTIDIICNSASAFNITIDNTLPRNFKCRVLNIGAGAVTFVAGTATISTPDGTTLNQNMECTVTKIANNNSHYVKGELV